MLERCNDELKKVYVGASMHYKLVIVLNYILFNLKLTEEATNYSLKHFLNV